MVLKSSLMFFLLQKKLRRSHNLDNFLKDVKICDLTSRLPGPMATMILADLGAFVVKVENSKFGGDNFKHSNFAKSTPNFLDWYKNLNKGKSLKILDFEKDEKLLLQELSDANIILIPDTKSIGEIIDKLDNSTPRAIIKLSGGQGQWRALHDLNAIAMTKVFKFQNLKNLPLLPFAGISFAQMTATTALAQLRAVEKANKTIVKTIYLKDITEYIFDSLHSEQCAGNGHFLHNGAFPCYQIYSSSDGRAVCLAAIESKFWMGLSDLFKLELTDKDRFDTSGKVKKHLSEHFKQFTADELRASMAQTKVCLTII